MAKILRGPSQVLDLSDAEVRDAFRAVIARAKKTGRKEFDFAWQQSATFQTEYAVHLLDFFEAQEREDTAKE